MISVYYIYLTSKVVKVETTFFSLGCFCNRIRQRMILEVMGERLWFQARSIFIPVLM